MSLIKDLQLVWKKRRLEKLEVLRAKIPEQLERAKAKAMKLRDEYDALHAELHPRVERTGKAVRPALVKATPK